MTAHISVHIYVHANVAFRDHKNRVKPSLGAQLGANKGHSTVPNYSRSTQLFPVLDFGDEFFKKTEIAKNGN